MKNKNIKIIENVAQLLGAVGFVILIASPTGAELGNYDLFGFLFRAFIGAVTIAVSGQMMCMCDALRNRSKRERR